jgi:hypothetical protein
VARAMVPWTKKSEIVPSAAARDYVGFVGAPAFTEREARPSEFLFIGRWGLYRFHFCENFREVVAEVAGVFYFFRPPFIILEMPNREENVAFVKVVKEIIKITFITGLPGHFPFQTATQRLGEMYESSSTRAGADTADFLKASLGNRSL